MFRRKTPVDKAKLEHKLYLARENPEPVFDISDCYLRDVPSGIYSLCRVFLKESLRLENNCLSSLSGGGQLKDLELLRILNLNSNYFQSLPEDIYLLKNLRECYINNNQLKKLPENISRLINLRVLDVSNNILKMLPETIGNLLNLTQLDISGNNHLKRLPRSISKCQRLRFLRLDSEDFIYPPSVVVECGTESILTYVCGDVGIPYAPSEPAESQVEEAVQTTDTTDYFQARIWDLERIKQKKVQEFLEIEKQNELLQKQEIELANTSKANRQKLLAKLSEQQTQFDSDLSKLHQEKEYERFRLIEQLQEAEDNADIAIKQLLQLNRKPLRQLLERERREEERLLAAVNRYSETLRKDDILTAMQDILGQEAEKFREFNQNRMEISRSILEQEVNNDTRLLEVLQYQEEHKAELVNALKVDSDLQKAAVGTLLERGDARSWGLLQQVRLVESQLAALTHIEIDRRKLQMDEHLNDLAEKRINLSILLIDLLEQQNERRSQLLNTLQTMEARNNSIEDFWLKQYQSLLDKLPKGLSQAQTNMDPALSQALLVNGVIHCLPFLAKLTQDQYDTRNITDADLVEAGVLSKIDRTHILDALQMYEKEKLLSSDSCSASAPPIPVEEASAPPPDLPTVNSSECVICLELECQVVFVPCGHLCCCIQCSTSVSECPLCRADIERKITVHRS